MTRDMRLEKGLLKIGEVAREAQISVSTVRYYTEIGLLKVLVLTDSGYRLYKKDDALSVINIIKTVKDRNLSLSEIRSNFEITE